MSRDFFSVSSTLHAENRAAAAACCRENLIRMANFTLVERPNTYHEIVLAIGMLESKFMIVDNRGIECSNWPGLGVSISP